MDEDMDTLAKEDIPGKEPESIRNYTGIVLPMAHYYDRNEDRAIPY